MQKRNTRERRSEIVAWVNQQGHVQVDDLAERFETSAVTIRKDLSVLADDGLLLRQFGGAAPLMPADKSFTDKSAASPIGKAAATLLSHNAKIVIDCGSTTASLLPFLNQFEQLVVMTNSLNAATILTQVENEPTVLMTGGTWDAHSQSFQGSMAEHMIGAYTFDFAFIGAAGLDVIRGTTTFNELTGLTRAMARAARQVVVMASSSKLSHRMPNLELGWDSISVLITDSGISQSDKQHIEDQGVTVMVAAQFGD